MARRTDGKQQQPKELRMVLVGKTGSGKSAAGNTILRREAFVSDIVAASVTKECAKGKAKVEQRKVAVIDTPGLFDTELSNDEVIKEIIKCICLSAPGPHVFLVVIQIGRFTIEEQETVEIIQKTFGDDSAKYTMALFTHGDQLKGKPIEEFLAKNGKLAKFISQCGGGCHVFNNQDKDPSQVLELIKKIDKMVATNGGGCYTNETYMKAEEEIEETTKQNLKNKADMSEDKAREMAEKDNSILSTLGEVGHAAFQGAKLGAIGGPVGAVIGGVVGAATGLVTATKNAPYSKEPAF